MNGIFDTFLFLTLIKNKSQFFFKDNVVIIFYFLNFYLIFFI